MKSKILIVDDSFLTRSMLKKFLNENGYDTIEATDGRQALEKIETEKPECIITDLLMPNMDGISFLRELKEKNISVPVIVFTANIQKKVIDECKGLGAKAFFHKPPKLDNYSEKENFLAVLNSCMTRTDEDKFEKEINIPERHIDILSEMINIGMGRAAASLNELLNSFISLQIPKVWIFKMDSMPEELARFGDSPLFIIRQNFEGPFSGRVALIFPPDSAKSLICAVTGEEYIGMDSMKAGTLCEIGNILINGVMGSICNVLESTVNFSLPEFMEKNIPYLINDVVGDSRDEIILMAKTCFTIEDLKIEGHFLLLLDSKSFSNLIKAVEELEKKELGK